MFALLFLARIQSLKHRFGQGRAGQAMASPARFLCALSPILNAGVLLFRFRGRGRSLLLSRLRHEKECSDGPSRILPFSPRRPRVALRRQPNMTTRLAGLRVTLMEVHGVDSLCFHLECITSPTTPGFLYCSLRSSLRPCWSLPTEIVSRSALVSMQAQPWRRCHGDNITYTDWQREQLSGVRSSVGDRHRQAS